MASNIKKVFGMAKKKSEDLDEEVCSYTDPAVVHSTEPPSRNSRGFSQPHYPPPRPQHSPNPRRKNFEGATQGKKGAQANDTARNSAVEPRRAPPRPNIAKKDPSEDDYCEPIDVQRKDNIPPDIKNRAKDDYCEPWDSTKKTDLSNVPRKISQSDDEHNEYMDPYDTGKDGIIEKRRSRGIGKEFHSKIQQPNNELQRKSIAESNQAPDPRKATSDDYDMPWEWKKQNLQMGKAIIPKPKPAAQNQRQKQPSAKDDYDEPWENKQGYMLKTQPQPGPGKPRSPVPLPRVAVSAAGQDDLYEKPWDSVLQPCSNIPDKNNLYETPWEEITPEVNGNKRPNSPPRRASQPAFPTAAKPQQSRKSSQSAVAELADYDMPWEYKNAKKFQPVSPPKPMRASESTCDVNPDLPLDDQSWYHGLIKRQQAEELLRDAPDCSFLVRNSESSKRDFSLSMKNNENYLHLKIVRQLDGQFILGQFSKPFMDIPKVIHHYSRNKLNIRGAEHKYLKHPVAAQPEYHTIEPFDDDSHL